MNCRKCGTELTGENWYPSRKKKNVRLCKRCDKKRDEKWRINNIGRVKECRKEHCKARAEKNGRVYKPHNKNPAKNWKERTAHKERYKEKYRKYFHDNKYNYLEYWAKRKGRGFIPLNEWFDGADGHHIDKEHVIFMPMFIHRCIPHHHKDPDSMWVINCMALLWLLYGSIPETDMKLPEWIFKPLPNEKYKQLTLS